MRPQVTTALAPSSTLSAADRCDRCGAQAYVRVTLTSGGEPLFCAHHSREHAEKLRSIAAVHIHDETGRPKPPRLSPRRRGRAVSPSFKRANDGAKVMKLDGGHPPGWPPSFSSPWVRRAADRAEAGSCQARANRSYVLEHRLWVGERHLKVVIRTHLSDPSPGPPPPQHRAAAPPGRTREHRCPAAGSTTRTLPSGSGHSHSSSRSVSNCPISFHRQ